MKFFTCSYAAVIAALVVPVQLVVAAELCSATSGVNRAAVVELYTSEGCSSCPPADAWLSSLPKQAISEGQIVPLAMHVDYWDYIGWKDPFAMPVFSARQRDMAQWSPVSQVYTPQVALNGESFRAWNSDDFARAVKRLNQSPAQASIKLTMTPANAGKTLLEVHAQAGSGAVLYVAVYQNALSSDIRAGENTGRRLQHDYVVREWYGPVAIAADGNVHWQTSLNMKPGWVEKNMGAAALVQNETNGDILQALRLPWCGRS